MMNEESLKKWEQKNIELLTSREMGEWLYRRDMNARPQGEWIKVKEDRMSIDMSGELVTQYKCSKCGRPIAILSSKLADYPFCHCGAEMKGGAE